MVFGAVQSQSHFSSNVICTRIAPVTDVSNRALRDGFVLFAKSGPATAGPGYHHKVPKGQPSPQRSGDLIAELCDGR